MPNVEVAIRFRRKTGQDAAAESAGFHVVENNIANEIGRRRKFGLSHLTETFLFWIM